MPDPAPVLVPSSTSKPASSPPPKPFKCPKCPRTFKKRTGLGSHLRTHHNVIGKSKSAIAFREQKKRGRPAAAGKLKFHCPECKERFAYAQVLGRHRRLVHKTLGTSKEALRRRGESKGTIQCPRCEFRAVGKFGLAIHLSQKHAVRGAHHAKHEAALAKKLRRLDAPNSAAIVRVEQQTEGDNHAIEQAENGGLAPATLQVALGRFQEFCRNFASEYDLPPRLFAARFAELIYAAQVRQSLGSPVRVRHM
jgi:DNA-directed RNA polymerase subunit M/transcription elongation factor TFIIS